MFQCRHVVGQVCSCAAQPAPLRDVLAATRRSGAERVAQPRMTIPTQLVLTALLSDPESERYGVEIGSAAGLPSGTVHPILARLEGAGWITSRWEEIDPRNGRSSGAPLLPAHRRGRPRRQSRDWPRRIDHGRGCVPSAVRPDPNGESPFSARRVSISRDGESRFSERASRVRRRPSAGRHPAGGRAPPEADDVGVLRVEVGAGSARAAPGCGRRRRRPPRPGPEALGEGVGGGRAHAARGRDPGDHDRVDPGGRAAARRAPVPANARGVLLLHDRLARQRLQARARPSRPRRPRRRPRARAPCARTSRRRRGPRGSARTVQSDRATRVPGRLDQRGVSAATAAATSGSANGPSGSV